MIGPTDQVDLWHSFSWGSSPVDWCESNFAYSIYIAEYFNTVSNLPVVILPLLGLHLFSSYMRKVNNGIRFVFWLMICVGLCSAYFHATLSLFGQLLDELAILWVTVAAVCTWMPSLDGVPDCIMSNMTKMRRAIISFAAITSMLSMVEPTVNAYLLISLCPPMIVLMFREVRRVNNKTASQLAVATAVLWTTAITVWVSDRLMCGFWKKIDFPYLHAFWHLLSAISSYAACLMFPFLETLRRKPGLKPTISYWPKHFPIIPHLLLDVKSLDQLE